MDVDEAASELFEHVVDRLFKYMEEQGYTSGAPSPRVEKSDRQMFEFESRGCLKCKSKNVRFYPFFRANPYSYRSFVMCRECRWEREV